MCGSTTPASSDEAKGHPLNRHLTRLPDSGVPTAGPAPEPRSRGLDSARPAVVRLGSPLTSRQSRPVEQPYANRLEPFTARAMAFQGGRFDMKSKCNSAKPAMHHPSPQVVTNTPVAQSSAGPTNPYVLQNDAKCGIPTQASTPDMMGHCAPPRLSVSRRKFSPASGALFWPRRSSWISWPHASSLLSWSIS